MANEEQLAILKQGVSAWNEWRNHTETSNINLAEADLCDIDLEGIDLEDANLINVNFTGCNLQKAKLSKSNLSYAKLHNTNLCNADLDQALLFRSEIYYGDVRNANLTNADLKEASLFGVDFSGSDLNGITLISADLMEVILSQSNLQNAEIGGTSFIKSDLSHAKGLVDIIHYGPSSISTDTIAISNGGIPDDFLRGCGMSDWEIRNTKLYVPNLGNEEINEILYSIFDLRASQALQVSPLFISYGHEDGDFVDKLEQSFDKKGVRFWRDIHNMKSGRLETQIDRAIRQNPTVLLILSENSLNSDWVEHETRMARSLEDELKRDVLCPVALDDSWKSSRWPRRIMEQIMEYNILDFSEWADDSKFDDKFRKLIDGLELFYKG